MKIQKDDSSYTRQLGLTLIEMLIAMAITSIIIGALVTAFISHNRTSAAEEARMELQQNLRVAADRLSHVLRHAGFGCYDSFAKGKNMSGSDPKDDHDISISSSLSNIENQDGNGGGIASDSLILIYGFRKVGEVDISKSDPEKYEIKLKNTKGPVVTANSDFKRYLSFYPTRNSNTFYRVKSVNDDGDDITIAAADDFKNIDFASEPDVFMVSPARIFLDNDGRLNNQIFSYQSIPKQFNPAQYWILAENIKDIQFKFYVHNQGWKDDPTNDEIENQKIRKVKFTILGEKDANGKTISMKSQGEVVLRNAF